MWLAEQLFHADSDAALALLPAVTGDAGADQRWQLVLLGLDRLLADLLPDPADRHAVVRSARDRLAADLGLDAAGRRRLGSRHRRDRDVLEVAVAGPTPAPYTERSRRLRPIVAELRASDLDRPLPLLAGHYLHMHANRMVRSAVREHELVLYDHLDRLYLSAAARSARGSLRSTIQSTPPAATGTYPAPVT
jgi:thiopeptide-type bacteriocin biosynthesis protein